MSDTGTGKTVTALLLCKQLAARPVVLTRKAVLSGWEQDCKRVGVEPLALVNYEAAKSDRFDLGKLEATGRDRKTGEPTGYRYDWKPGLGRVIFLFDESQNCGSMVSQNSKMLLGAAKMYKTVCLSATPFSTPLQAGPQMCALRLATQADWYPWLFRHGCRKNHFNAWEFVGDRRDRVDAVPGANAAEGKRIMSELNAQILPSRGVRTRRGEIPGFPQTVLSTVSVKCPSPGEVLKEYMEALYNARQMDLDRVKEQLPPELHEIAQVLPMVADLRDRQEAEILKLPIIEEMVEDALAKGESVVVFLNFDLTIEALSKRLGVTNIIRGSRKGEKNNYDRGMRIHRFRTNLARVQIINSCAGGAGLSCHDSETKVPRTSIISPPWSALVLKQVFGRVQRLEGGFSQQKLLFAKGTVEDRVRVRVENRLDNVDSLTDGDLAHF